MSAIIKKKTNPGKMPFIKCETCKRGGMHLLGSKEELLYFSESAKNSLGKAFFGESMFSRKTDASKIALVALVGRLREKGFELLDTQWVTAHLRTFGGFEIPQEKYLSILNSVAGAKYT